MSPTTSSTTKPGDSQMTTASPVAPSSILSSSATKSSENKSPMSWARLAQQPPKMDTSPQSTQQTPSSDLSNTIATSKGASPSRTDSSDAKAIKANPTTHLTAPTITSSTKTRSKSSSPKPPSTDSGLEQSEDSSTSSHSDPNIWTKRLENQHQKQVEEKRSDDKRHREERSRQQAARERAKKEEEEARKAEEERDAAEGFVKVVKTRRSNVNLSVSQRRDKDETRQRNGSAAAKEENSSKSPTPTAANNAAPAKEPVVAPSTEATVSNNDAATTDSPNQSKPSPSEPQVPKKPHAPVSAKFVVTNTRSENLLKETAAPIVTEVTSWPSLKDAPIPEPKPHPRPTASHTPTDASSVASDTITSSGPHHKKSWVKLDVPIYYPPPTPVSAKKDHKGNQGHRSPAQSNRSVNGERERRTSWNVSKAQGSGPTPSVSPQSNERRRSASALAGAAATSSTLEKPSVKAVPEESSEASTAALSTTQTNGSESEAAKASTSSEVDQTSSQLASSEAVTDVDDGNSSQTSQRGGSRGGRGGASVNGQGYNSGRGGRGRGQGGRGGQTRRGGASFNGMYYPQNTGFAPGFVPSPMGMVPNYMMPMAPNMMGYGNYGYPYGFQQMPQRPPIQGQLVYNGVPLPPVGAPIDPMSVDFDTIRGWIRYQIEYYFSIENLCRDMYFRSQMNPQTGTVPLFVIANFNRVRSFTSAARAKAGILPPKSVDSNATKVEAGSTNGVTATINEPELPTVSIDSPEWSMEYILLCLQDSEVVEAFPPAVENTSKVGLGLRRKDGWENWVVPAATTPMAPQPYAAYPMMNGIPAGAPYPMYQQPTPNPQFSPQQQTVAQVQQQPQQPQAYPNAAQAGAAGVPGGYQGHQARGDRGSSNRAGSGSR